MRVAVVGAGLAGAACARELRASGIEVRVLDRGHRVGGRMASRRLDGRAVDLGASYLTVSDADFSAVVEDWHDRGLARPWTDTFCALSGSDVEVKHGGMRWGAQHGLRSLVEDLARDLAVERRTVDRVDDLEAEAVVLAMPDPQARRLVADDHPVAAMLDRDYEPVLALAAQWAARSWDGVSPTGRFDGAFVNDHDTLAWIADDGRRRGDDAPVLVAHSSPAFAREHLGDPEAAVGPLLGALRSTLALGEPESVHLHRWTFARPLGQRAERFGLVESGNGLTGVCGDGWGPVSKVETAWLSGRDLGRALVQRLR